MDTRKDQPNQILQGPPVRPQMGEAGKDDRASGMVAVRLAPEASAVVPDRNVETLEAHAKAYELSGLARVLEEAGSPPSHRLVSSVPPEQILEMERAAAQTEFPPLHSLVQYWRLDLRGRSQEEIARLLESLSSLREVDAAYEEPLATLPVVTPTDDPYNAQQGYQDAAPTGIDARWMWGQPNGEGAGVGVVDVEGGWRVTHEDLAGKSPTLIHGVQYASWEDHGTAVLGEIVASDNTVGVVGGAPAVSSVRMSSIYDAAGTQNVTDALTAAVAAMSVGQILLIELQTSFLPMETVDSILDIIRLGTARGIVVIEAGGNGNSDLDAWMTPGGLQRLNRTSANFIDSGAIMVGACVSAVPHDRWWASNFGSRINCFAWGENVVSTGYGTLDNGGGNADRWYTSTFQGTSSASPIIVSAAALVQGNYIASTGSPLSPGQMRALLSNPATGTAQGTGVAGAIGVMPNLGAIVPNLGLVPDVYLRDAVGDTGAIPWGGAISVSPDVIVQASPVANPQAAYGQGSGTENSDTLGSEVESGQENSVYVRVRNRGGSAAANVVATVYWSEVATLVTPSSWQLIGSVTLPSVPVGDVLTVSPRLAWPKAGIPGIGHYCFVATLQHPADPAPPTPGPLDWGSFQDLIRAHNNVTWRNFNVVNNLPDPPDATIAFEFKVAGADDRARKFVLEVERRLPEQAVLELAGPIGLLARLRGENPWELTHDREGGSARLLLPPLPRVALAEVALPPGARLVCEFRVSEHKGNIAYGHGLAVRQLHEGQEVGRINWQFAPEPCLCEEGKRN